MGLGKMRAQVRVGGSNALMTQVGLNLEERTALLDQEAADSMTKQVKAGEAGNFRQLANMLDLPGDRRKGQGLAEIGDPKPGSGANLMRPINQVIPKRITEILGKSKALNQVAGSLGRNQERMRIRLVSRGLHE